MDRVEGDGVDRVDELAALVLYAMALERVLALLHLGVLVEVLHRDAALDGGEHERLARREAADRSRLVLEKGAVND